MFGPRIRNVFRSRWQALFWSASMLLTAYCSVPSAEQTEQEDAAAARVASHERAARNPWAKDDQAP